MNLHFRMIRIIKNTQLVKYILRFGIACTFVGHGMNAIAVKQGWLHLLTVYGFTLEQAKTLMPVIGFLDLLVALLVLLYPMRVVVRWAAFWAFATALTRFIAGEGIWEFIERGANWAAPLALLLLNDLPAKEKVENLNRKEIRKLARKNIFINNFLSLVLLFICDCLYS
jgi:hypothetical protein